MAPMQIGSSSTSVHVNLKMDLNKQDKPSIATHKNPPPPKKRAMNVSLFAITNFKVLNAKQVWGYRNFASDNTTQ